VVDLMRLLPAEEHPHGLTDREFEDIFPISVPVVFAYHGYPWLIHRLTYRRVNQHRLHVRGYKEEGTITTPFDMTVLNEMSRFHLAMDVIDRLQNVNEKAVYVKQLIKDKLIEHRQYINLHGRDLPDIVEWSWNVS
jgi:xylulose-5-phosphate/fructose-6-phosphate phosphoketolase